MEPKKLVGKALDKALTVQQPIAEKQVDRLRRVHPDETPQQMVKRLNGYFLTAVTSSGAASGAGGSVPGFGVPAALADVAAFTEAATLYVLARAEVHGLHPEDFERRKLLVLTVLIGESATGAIHKGAEKTTAHWAKMIVSGIPYEAIKKANKVLGHNFITKYGTKQGVLVLGKQVPMGIGAVLGGGGNHLVGRLTIKTAGKIFGPPPVVWADAVADDAHEAT